MANLEDEDPPQEHLLLQEISRSDARAFGRLIETYGPRLYSLAFRFSKNQQAAEDAVQEVFIQVWQMRSALPEVRNLNGFLLTLVRNYVVNAIKKTIREEYHRKRWHEQQPGESYIAYKQDPITSLVEQALGSLSPQQLRVWTMSRRLSMTYHEIAQKLKISTDAVNKYLQAANKKIIKFITERQHLLHLMIIWLSLQ